jgi:hypothetical protein
MPNPREKLPPRLSDLHTRARYRRRRMILIVGCIFLFTLAFSLWWLVVQSDVLRFREIEVDGNTRLTDAEVLDLLKEKIAAPSFWGRILGQDHFFAWPKSLSEKQINTLGNIHGVSFSRDYWDHRLKITVEERQFFGILCARKNDVPQCVWFDSGGFFFEDAFFPEGPLILRVDDYSKNQVSLGEYLYPSEKLKNALSAFAIIKSLDWPASNWTIRDTAPDILEVKLIDGPDIYFNLNFSSDYAVQVIKSLAEQKGIKNLQYIDFRIENRTYYKDNSSGT